MFSLRSVSLIASVLLFGTTNVASYDPQYGEIVHVAPQHTTGASVGTGSTRPHPHIALGHDHNTGHVILAPVTHNSYSDHLKPHMPAPAQHGLQGIVRLDHVTAHPGAISPPHGPPRILSHGNLQRITGAQGLVHDHRNAGNAHSLVAQSHRGSEAWHDQQSAHHFSTGNMQAGQHHAQQASTHRGHAETHEAASNNHYHAANEVHGPNHVEQHHAQQSAQHAYDSHHASNEAARHSSAAHGFSQQGNHFAAHQANQAASGAHHAASQSAAAAIHSHNQATGHHL